MKSFQLKLFKYKKYISGAGSIVRSFSDYAISRTPLSFIGGIYDAGEKILNLKSYNGFDEFNPSNNWFPLFSSNITSQILKSVLQDIPAEALDFEHSSCKLLTLDDMQFVVMSDNWDQDAQMVLCQPNDKAPLLQRLAELKMKELGGENYLELIEVERDKRNVEIAPFPMKVFESKNADQLIKHLENVYAKKIFNRSLALWGMPGTGKTSISAKLLSHFNFKTLKFRPSETLTLNVLIEIVDLFKIEAVILDDMDRLYTDDRLLNFLDILNSKVKLTIGICNSLTALDPALLRPGRFDEVIKVEGLDENTIKLVLGPLYDEYHEKVKNFPIAYLNELSKHHLLDEGGLEEKFLDLKDRVARLEQYYKERKILKEEEKEEDDDNDDCISSLN